MTDPAPVPEAEFTREFLRRAVTLERVVAALESLAQKELRFGPYSAAGIAGIVAVGALDPARVRVVDPAAPTFAVTIPAALDVTVRLGTESRLRADVEIDLALVPRGAHPLLLVIDVAPVRSHDVRVQVRGRGITGAALGGLLSALSAEIGAQVARQVNGIVDAERLRRSRTFDIAARVAGERDAPVGRTWEWIDDERWGRQFVRAAVTDDRVAEAFAAFAGAPLEIGPLEAGPRGVATVTAQGAIGNPTVVGAAGTFAVTLPLQLDLVVDLGRRSRFHADIEVGLVATARTARDLHLVVDIAPVDPAAVQVRLEAADTLARVLGRAGRIEEQIRHQVVRAVDARVARAKGRVIDVGERIDRAGTGRLEPASRPAPP